MRLKRSATRAEAHRKENVYENKNILQSGSALNNSNVCSNYVYCFIPQYNKCCGGADIYRNIEVHRQSAQFCSVGVLSDVGNFDVGGQ